VLLANRPGAEIDEYAIDSMSFVTEHRLTPGDSTIASYVTTHVAADAATGSTFATLINADDADDRRLARLEPGRGRTASMVPVVGADALALVDRGAGASLVLVGNARTGTVEMLDAVTLQSVRTLKAPIDVRALVWEPRRSVVLAMGRLSRQVSAIDLRLGRVVKSARLDAVPRAIALDPKRDRLLVGDAHGLGAIDLASWLYPAPIAFAP
jgi:hypothetical protein